MADKVEEAGSWALSDVTEVLQENGVLPSNANEATAISNIIGALALSYAENSNVIEKSITLKVLRNGVFIPLTATIDIVNDTILYPHIMQRLIQT